jgi:predicted AAA+ superfamily ATPase
MIIMKLIDRLLTESIMEGLDNFPVVAITGPRQCGKSTLVKELIKPVRDVIYLDLERPSDIRKLDEPEWFFISQRGKIICLDEIQRKPELFPLIRSLADDWRSNGSFLILGSASPDLLRQSSESLAGRISYKRLTPFLWNEVSGTGSMDQYFSRGGFPVSFQAQNDKVSIEWRENFITTFLERDMLQWTGTSPAAMRRLWQMIAHLNGQTINYSAMANSLGVSHTTIRNYIDLLQSTYMLDIVQPHLANTGKRLIKSPKVYLNDSGIAAALLGLKDISQVAGHPVFGSLWEGIVLANLRGSLPGIEIRYYRTNHGSEIDFLIVLQDSLIAVECKAGLSPVISRGTYGAIEDLSPRHTYIVSPVEKGFPMKKGIDVVSLNELIEIVKTY